MRFVNNLLWREARRAFIPVGLYKPLPSKGDGTASARFAVERAVRIAMQIGNYLGTSFGIWKGRQAWFWFVVDAPSNGAAIGAAANETEAICEAHSSIEEIAARRLGTTVSETQCQNRGRTTPQMRSGQPDGADAVFKGCLVTEG
jgi:hypothetical protein